MTDEVFGKAYADQYDLLYGEKDYKAECDLIESVFHKYSKDRVKSILDMGCGTGSHAILLAQRGYRVTGVDNSEQMLSRAREKLKKLELFENCTPPEFIQGDVRSVDVAQQFDAVIMMFAVLSYQLSNEDVLAALSRVRRHLKPGGLFICDVWYGPAVLAIRPSDRVKVIPRENGKVIRAAGGTLDTFRHLCEVRYHLWHIISDRLVSETEESHWMRYFFPQELAMMLDIAGLKLLALDVFPDLGLHANESSWNALLIASHK